MKYFFLILSLLIVLFLLNNINANILIDVATDANGKVIAILDKADDFGIAVEKIVISPVTSTEISKSIFPTYRGKKTLTFYLPKSLAKGNFEIFVFMENGGRCELLAEMPTK
jgi:hypothetical protein